MSKCPNAQLHNCTTAQMLKRSNRPMPNSTTAQQHHLPLQTPDTQRQRQHNTIQHNTHGKMDSSTGISANGDLSTSSCPHTSARLLLLLLRPLLCLLSLSSTVWFELSREKLTLLPWHSCLSALRMTTGLAMAINSATIW